MQGLKIAGVFLGIVLAGVLWRQFSADMADSMKKETTKDAQKQWDRNPMRDAKPVGPIDTINGPTWSGTTLRSGPPPVNMQPSGKK
jgi:hypothetical protein